MYISCSFLLIAELYAFVWIGQSLFIHTFVDGLGCFQFGAIMNRSAMNNLVKYLFFIITKAKISWTGNLNKKSPAKPESLLDRKNKYKLPFVVDLTLYQAIWWNFSFHQSFHFILTALFSRLVNEGLEQGTDLSKLSQLARGRPYAAFYKVAWVSAVISKPSKDDYDVLFFHLSHFIIILTSFLFAFRL